VASDSNFRSSGGTPTSPDSLISLPSSRTTRARNAASTLPQRQSSAAWTRSALAPSGANPDSASGRVSHDGWMPCAGICTTSVPASVRKVGFTAANADRLKPKSCRDVSAWLLSSRQRTVGVRSAFGLNPPRNRRHCRSRAGRDGCGSVLP
jgi:hypothetical protein